MVGDGRDDRDAVLRRKIAATQNFISKQAAVLSMVGAVDGVADIVHISCDFCQLNVMGIVAELFQNMPGCVGHMDAVRLRVVGKPQQPQVFVAFVQQGVHFLVGAYLFVGHSSSTPKFVVQGSGPMYTTIRAFASKYNIPAVKAV